MRLQHIPKPFIAWVFGSCTRVLYTNYKAVIAMVKLRAVNKFTRTPEAYRPFHSPSGITNKNLSGLWNMAVLEPDLGRLIIAHSDQRELWVKKKRH